MAPKQKKPIGASRPPLSGPVTDDPRFARIGDDPRLAPPRRKQARVKLDKRFQGVLTDPRFTSKAKVDKYGRRLPQDAAKKELERLYQLGSDAEDEDDKDGEDEEATPKRFDPARGEGVVSSSEEESTDDESDSDVEAEAETDAQQSEEVPQGEVSRRLAVVNLDWDHVHAVDLLKTFSSFAPAGGHVERVTIFPSEFGRERMEREEYEGPPRELFVPKGKRRPVRDADADSDVDGEVSAKTIVKEDKGEEFDSGQLRRYQLERLRYYYAVVECDSETTAKSVYDACDGAEFEASANTFDLRFIPDDVDFEDDTPRDMADIVPDNYIPNEFSTDALQHSKVKLTWDADDNQRAAAAKRAFSQREVEDNELQAYLASSESESENEKAAKESAAAKYRALLGDLNLDGPPSPDGGMQVQFLPALASSDGKVFVSDDESEDEGSDAGLTTIEKYAKKERARKQRRKEAARLRKGLPANPSAPPEPQPKKEPEPPEAVYNPAAAAELGFNDPFFENPEEANAVARKEAKAKKRAERDAAAKVANGQRAELELLMADDADPSGNAVGADGKPLRHFDMKQIVKAEKASKHKKGKKGKYGKKGQKDVGAGGDDDEALQQGVEIDATKDPRFAAVFERHDFAIDPTNSRFVKSNVTEKMLEERRRRGKRAAEEEDGEGGEGAGGGSSRKKKRKADKEKEKQKQGRDELKSLVQSLKAKGSKKA